MQRKRLSKAVLAKIYVVLKGRIASKFSTVLAFGNSANNRRRYAWGSRPLARAVETML